MNVEEVNQIIDRLEREKLQCQMSVLGIDIWPLVRLVVWTELSQDRLKSRRKKYKLRELLDFCVDYLLMHLRTNSDRPRNTLPASSEVLFIGRPEHHQNIDGSDYLYDRVLDPLVFVIPIERTWVKACLGALPSGRTFLPTRRLRLRGLKKLDDTTTTDLMKLVTELEIPNIDSSILLRELMVATRTFLNGYYNGLSLFKSHPNFKYLVISTWYSADAMGLLAAASRLDIKSIDVQHGIQGTQHGMYGSWMNIPLGGYDLMPSAFWCWGVQNRNSILFQNDATPSIQTFIGGYPWASFRKLIQESLNFDTPTRSDNHMIRVAISLQPHRFNNVSVPDFLIDYLRTEHKETKIFLRMHPNDRERSTLPHLFKQLKLKTSYEFISSDSDLYSLLEISTHHVTAYSSVAYDALLAGVPTLLYGEESKAMMHVAIADKVFTWSTGTLSEFENFITNPLMACPSFEEHISTSQKLATDTLNRLLG